MNIFVLNEDPFAAAKDQCDKHVVKMVIEYGQMLSTAKRLRDGKYSELIVTNPETGKKKKITEYLLPEEGDIHAEWNDEEDGKFIISIDNQKCYRTAHANHPCSIWARENDSNYQWLYMMFLATIDEYHSRYGKQHQSERIASYLGHVPAKMPSGPLTAFAQAMPDEYKHRDAVQAYRRFYIGSKSRFATWNYSQVPDWYMVQ